MRVLLLAGAVGGTVGAAYSWYKREGLKKAILNPDGEGLPVIWKELPDVRISREVRLQYCTMNNIVLVEVKSVKYKR